jgi:hypothetical protein
MSVVDGCIHLHNITTVAHSCKIDVIVLDINEMQLFAQPIKQLIHDLAHVQSVIGDVLVV